MPVDLETRLRDYGQVLDRAAVGGVAATPLPRRPRAHATLLGAAAIIVVVAAAATLMVLRARSTGVAQGPASTVVAQDAGEPVTAADVLPVQLAEGVVPWYVLAPEDAASFEPLVVDVEVACSQWWVPEDSVECRAVATRRFEPQVAYADLEGGRSVTISTVHFGRMTAQQYSDAFAERYPLDPIGTMTTPVELSDGRPAVHTTGNDDFNQRVTFAMSHDTLVSVTARNMDRDELVGLADRLVPAGDVPSLPLLLAVPESWRYRPAEASVWLLGGVVDGEVCAFGVAPGIPDATRTCRRLGSEQVVITDRDDGVFGGLAGPDVLGMGLAFDLSFDDLSATGVRPTAQPVGGVQAFVTDEFVGPQPVVLTALGAGGEQLRVIDLHAGSLTRPVSTRPVETCTSYTIEFGDTPSSIAGRLGVTVDELRAANPDLLDAAFLPGALVNIPSYTIEFGDTPSSIAARLGVTVDELRAANPDLLDAAFLPGALVNIPCVPLG